LQSYCKKYAAAFLWTTVYIRLMIETELIGI